MTKREKLIASTITYFSVYTGVFLLCFALIFYIDYGSKKSIFNNFDSDIDRLLQRYSNLIEENIGASYRAIDFFHATPPIEGIARAVNNNGIDPQDNTPLELWYARLETILKSYLENNHGIDQARFIVFDEHGSERIRVEQVTGNVRVVSRSKMQGKASRDYYQFALQLNPGEKYISSINLNREWGKIQYPYKPTYRVARAVFDENNKAIGFLIVNVSVLALLDNFRAMLAPGYEFFLLNEKGGFIQHQNPEKDFGFELNAQDVWSAQMIDVKSDKEGLNSARMDNGEKLYYRQRGLELSEYYGFNTVTLTGGVTESSYKAALLERRLSTVAIIGAFLLLILALMIYFQRQVHKKMQRLKAQAEYRAIVNGSSDAVISMDAQGIIHSWNRSAEDIFGFSEGTATGRQIFELLLHEESQLFSLTSLDNVYRGQSIPAFDVLLHNRVGEEITVSVTLSPIVVSDDGCVEGVAAIFRDVTQQKIIEKQMLQMNASLEVEVERRTAELEAAKNEALALSDVKSNFIANVSHEIRTPMNGVIGMLHLIAKDPLSDAQKKYLAMANSSASALTGLVNDILDLSKIEAGKLTLESQAFDLYRLFGETCTSLAISAQAKHLGFVVDLAGVVHFKCEGDSNRIRQILINLVGNAIKFTARGHITVRAVTRLSSEGDVCLECSVIDTGVGIEKESQQKLFKTFSQEDESTARVFGGTGLGLAISKNLACMMGGDISVSSEKGAGSTFTFSLRLTQDGSCENHTLALPEYNKVKFYVVEGEDNHRAALSAIFKVMGVPCEAANTVNEKWFNDVALAGQPCILFYDPNSVDYSKVAGSLNSAINENTVAFIELTALMRVASQDNVIALAKPFTPRDVCLAVNRALVKLDVIEADVIADTEENPEQILNEKELHTRFAGCQVLLVDDNDINLEVGKGILEDLGLAVILANNGHRALEELAGNGAIELVLMDCQMPEMDGFEATKRIRNGEAGAQSVDIPILAMTANAMSGSKDGCLAQGMNDYLPKPVDPVQLTEKLLRWLRPVHHMDAAVLASPDVAAVQNIIAPEDVDSISKAPPSTEKTEEVRTDNIKGLTPIWDEEACVKRLKGRTDRIVRLMNMFIADTPNRLGKLHIAIEQENLVSITKLAHEVKGVAGNLSALLLAEMCAELEQAVSDNNIARIIALEPLLSPCCNEVLEQFQHYITRVNGPVKIAK